MFNIRQLDFNSFLKVPKIMHTLNAEGATKAESMNKICIDTWLDKNHFLNGRSVSFIYEGRTFIVKEVTGKNNES